MNEERIKCARCKKPMPKKSFQTDLKSRGLATISKTCQPCRDRRNKQSQTRTKKKLTVNSELNRIMGAWKPCGVDR